MGATRFNAPCTYSSLPSQHVSSLAAWPWDIINFDDSVKSRYQYGWVNFDLCGSTTSSMEFGGSSLYAMTIQFRKLRATLIPFYAIFVSWVNNIINPSLLADVRELIFNRTSSTYTNANTACIYSNNGKQWWVATNFSGCMYLLKNFIKPGGKVAPGFAHLISLFDLMSPIWYCSIDGALQSNIDLKLFAQRWTQPAHW